MNARYLGHFKEGGWVVVSQFIMLVGGIILLSVITKNVTIETFGKYALLLTVSNGISQVLFGGVNAATGRYYAIAEKEGDVAEYFYAVRYLVRLVGVIVCVIAVPVLVLAKGWGGMSTLTPALLILIFALISTYRSNLSRIQNAARLRYKVALFNACEVTLKIVLLSIL